jgi:hypothetical protein
MNMRLLRADNTRLCYSHTMLQSKVTASQILTPWKRARITTTINQIRAYMTDVSVFCRLLESLLRLRQTQTSTLTNTPNLN